MKKPSICSRVTNGPVGFSRDGEQEQEKQVRDLQSGHVVHRNKTTGSSKEAVVCRSPCWPPQLLSSYNINLFVCVCAFKEHFRCFLNGLGFL